MFHMSWHLCDLFFLHAKSSNMMWIYKVWRENLLNERTKPLKIFSFLLSTLFFRQREKIQLQQNNEFFIRTSRKSFLCGGVWHGNIWLRVGKFSWFSDDSHRSSQESHNFRMNSRERQIVFLTKECWILMHPPNNDDNDIIIRINQQLEGRKTSILLTLNFINFPLSECHWVNLARKTLKINHHYSHFFFIIVFHVVFFLSWFFRSQREFMRPNYSLSGSSAPHQKMTFLVSLISFHHIHRAKERKWVEIWTVLSTHAISAKLSSKRYALHTVDCTECKQKVRVKVNRVYVNANWKIRAEIIDYTSNMHWTHKLLTGRALANICLRLQTNFSRARRRRLRIKVETGLCTYFLISMLSPRYLCRLAYWCTNGPHTMWNFQLCNQIDSRFGL